jgi:hypothetical protein
MYIIPILIRKIRQEEQHAVLQCWILLERNGTYCMEANSVEEATLFASENGLDLTGPPTIHGEFVFLDISPATKGLHLFYTWAETTVGASALQDVWRPFVWVLGATDVLGTNVYLSDVSLGHDHSAYSVLTTYFKAKPVSTIDEFNIKQA